MSLTLEAYAAAKGKVSPKKWFADHAELAEEVKNGLKHYTKRLVWDYLSKEHQVPFGYSTLTRYAHDEGWI